MSANFALTLTTGSKFECPGEGYQEDPNDCTKFYRCISTESGRLEAYEFKCGPGTVYSSETENCVHPRDSSRPECASISENLIDDGDGKNFIQFKYSEWFQYTFFQ